MRADASGRKTGNNPAAASVSGLHSAADRRCKKPLLLSGTRPLRVLSNSSCSAVCPAEGHVHSAPLDHEALAVLLQAVRRRQGREAASIGEVLVGNLVRDSQ